MKPELIEAFSFDFSAHKVPLAYKIQETSVELYNKLKLIPQVKDREGGIFLNQVCIYSIYDNNNICIGFLIVSVWDGYRVYCVVRVEVVEWDGCVLYEERGSLPY